jgi:outer membrane immunogenic protein
MKKQLRASMALAAIIAGPAMAADMAVKAPSPAAYYYDWSGVYIGASIGNVWTNVDRFYPNLPLQGLPPTTFTSRSSDVLYDIHAGAQVQWGWLILGVEASYNAGFREMQSNVSVSPPEPFTHLSAYNKITNLFTVGPRLGIAWDRWMVYGAGGYAAASIKGQYACTDSGVQVLPGPGACGAVFGSLAALNFGGDTWNDGWFAGGGFEYMIYKGVLVDAILGAEYQHFDVGQKQAFCFSPGCSPPTHQDFLQGAHGDLVRARLTIKTQGWKFIAP